MKKNVSLNFQLEKLTYLVNQYYELDEVPMELLVQIERRAGLLKNAAIYTRSSLNFEEDKI